MPYNLTTFWNPQDLSRLVQGLLYFYLYLLHTSTKPENMAVYSEWPTTVS